MTSSKCVSSKCINITAFHLDVFTDMSNRSYYYYILLYRLYRCSINSNMYLRLNDRIRSNLFSIYEQRTFFFIKFYCVACV